MSEKNDSCLLWKSYKTRRLRYVDRTPFLKVKTRAADSKEVWNTESVAARRHKINVKILLFSIKSTYSPKRKIL